MTFEVEREAGTGTVARQREGLTATPDDTPPRTKSAVRTGEPVDLAGLGLCYQAGPVSSRFVPTHLRPRLASSRAT